MQLIVLIPTSLKITVTARRNRRDKLLAWGCDRLHHCEQDMETLLGYLQDERAQVQEGPSSLELDELITLLETQRAEMASTRQRLMHIRPIEGQHRATDR